MAYAEAEKAPAARGPMPVDEPKGRVVQAEVPLTKP